MAEELSMDDLLKSLIDNQRRYKDEIADIETKEQLKTATPEEKTKKRSLKAALTSINNEIDDLVRLKNEVKHAEVQEQEKITISAEQEIIKELIGLHNIGYLIKENKYIYCMGMENGDVVVNPIFDTVESSRFGRILNKMSNKKLKLGDRVLQDNLADFFQAIHKDYYMTTTSFNRTKWSKEKVYNKADVISGFWVMPDFADMESYDKRFDFLLRCIGGGKQENIEHLEKWVAFKYLRPDAVANTPNLDIGGYPGGNGKGRFVELCKTIFTNPCVSPAALKELMDGFNASWEMAVLLYYDEPSQDELPEGKLKSATGGEDIRIEKKGIDATVADRNYSIVFLSNNPNGVVKLAGTGSSGEDRRYSVMTTNLVMVDEAEKLGMNTTEAKVYVNEINNLIKNRKEVAKWLAHVIMKHNVAEMEVLQPLHGQDYKARHVDQKSSLDIAFDRILPIFIDQGILPYEILKAAVITLTGYEKLSDKKLKQDWKRYLEKSKIQADYLDGNLRPKIDYTWKTDTETVVKTLYRLNNGTYKEFDLTKILKKKPTNLKLAKEAVESATPELLAINED